MLTSKCQTCQMIETHLYMDKILWRLGNSLILEVNHVGIKTKDVGPILWTVEYNRLDCWYAQAA